MPENLYEWMWFIFFTVGSLGGWAFISIFSIAVYDEMKKRRHAGLKSNFKQVLGND